MSYIETPKRCRYSTSNYKAESFNKKLAESILRYDCSHYVISGKLYSLYKFLIFSDSDDYDNEDDSEDNEDDISFDNISTISFDAFTKTIKNETGWTLKDGRQIADVLAKSTAQTLSLVSDKSKKEKTPYILSAIRYHLLLLLLV